MNTYKKILFKDFNANVVLLTLLTQKAERLAAATHLLFDPFWFQFCATYIRTSNLSCMYLQHFEVTCAAMGKDDLWVMDRHPKVSEVYF